MIVNTIQEKVAENTKVYIMYQKSILPSIGYLFIIKLVDLHWVSQGKLWQGNTSWTHLAIDVAVAVAVIGLFNGFYPCFCEMW